MSRIRALIVADWAVMRKIVKGYRAVATPRPDFAVHLLPKKLPIA